MYKPRKHANKLRGFLAFCGAATFSRRLLIILFLNLTLVGASFSALESRGTSEAIAPENNPLMVEMYRIKIPNIKGGTIEVSEDKGSSWKKIGNVLFPAQAVSDQGYTASMWVSDGDIAAVAVNAIHIKTDFNNNDDRGVIFSIVPKEISRGSPTSEMDYGTSIHTNIKAGKDIFGGGYSPFVGNRVSVIDTKESVSLIKTGYVPKAGDTLLIIVERPSKYPKEIIFENRFGGLIMIKYIDGDERYIGQVLRPIEGVGRFLGTEYADVGRLRANHAGVICIATSPLGLIGGFQIIPAGHGMSKEMKTARTLTQWMVIGPVNALDPSFEGVAPFFKYFLQPKYNEDDIDQPDWKKRLLERFLVEVKYKDKDGWQMMPVYSMRLDKPLPKWANTAMEVITHIRILFPIYLEK